MGKDRDSVNRWIGSLEFVGLSRRKARSTVVYAGGRAGEERGIVRDDQPQTYIHGPNIYKHHVRIGATRSRPMRSVTEFASRPPALRLVHNYVPACPVSVIAWTPRSQVR